MSTQEEPPEALEALRSYWDEDARTYDLFAVHGAHSTGERAAWAAVLSRLLPAPGSTVLDVGAGTGFLSLAAARLGHNVTALDISPQMLARLEAKAATEQLPIETVEGSASEPPPGPFDAVVERFLLWTLPDPVSSLAAWRERSPAGRLLVFQSGFGSRDYVEAVKRRARKHLHRLRQLPPEHHDEYDEDLVAQLPLQRGATPNALIELIEEAGWKRPRLERLWDVEWAGLLGLPPHERLFGTVPLWVIYADAE